MARKIKTYLWWAFLAAATALSVYLLIDSLRARSFVGRDVNARVRGPNNLRIGLVGDSGSDLLVLAYEAGLFEEEGVLVDLAPQATHQKALRELAGEELDLAVLSDVPLGLMLPNARDLAVIATVGEGARDMQLATRADAGITSAADLKGKRVGVEDQNGERYALDLLLAKHDLTAADLTIVPLETAELGAALRRGDIAAVADAFADKYSPIRAINKNTEQPAVPLVEHGLIPVRFCLVAPRPIIAAKRELILKTLRALIAAREHLRRSFSESAKLVGRGQHVAPTRVAQRWRRYGYALALGPQILTSFEAQERWLRQRNPDAPAMDWPSVLAPELLTEIAPKKVKLPR